MKSLESLYYEIFVESLLLGKFRCKCKHEDDFDKKKLYEDLMSRHGNRTHAILLKIDWCKHLILEALV